MILSDYQINDTFNGQGGVRESEFMSYVIASTRDGWRGGYRRGFVDPITDDGA